MSDEEKLLEPIRVPMLPDRDAAYAVIYSNFEGSVEIVEFDALGRPPSASR